MNVRQRTTLWAKPMAGNGMVNQIIISAAIIVVIGLLLSTIIYENGYMRSLPKAE